MDSAPAALPSPSTPLRVYLAGELFSAKHLAGNAALAEAIRRLSAGRLDPLAPQDIELRDLHPHAIRDADLLALLACDLAVFHYDGPELDSGTVVEFLFAKFADIPAVLLRTDFRSAGDQGAGGDPWNLMTSFYPRTKSVVIDSIAIYKKHLAASPVSDSSASVNPAHSIRRAATALLASVAATPAPEEPASLRATRLMHEEIARHVIAALDEVRALPPVLPPSLAGPVYSWLSLLPNLRGPAEQNLEHLRRLLDQKQERGLLQ